MIHKYALLLKVQMLNAFGINKIIHSHNKKEKSQAVFMAFAWLIVIVILLIYSALNSYSCVQMGIVHTLPSIMLMVCSLITLFLTFMKSSGVLFGLRDYDMVMSMPVNSSLVVLSRLTMVYIMNLLISFIVIAPSIVIYGINAEATVSVYIMLTLSLFLAPLIPMIISMAIGAVITAVASRFRHKNIFALILNMSIVLAVIYFSMTLQEGSLDQLSDLETLVDQLSDLETLVAESVNAFYPPAGLFSAAVNNNDWLSYGLFSLISIGIFVLFTFVTAKFYSKINTAMFSYSKRNNYRISASELKASGAFNALYRKELRRLFSCTTYALNCCIGAAMLIMAGIAVLFVDPVQIIQSDLNLSENIIKNYTHCVPFLLAFFIGMSSTTCVALSLEGKYRWLMCSAPVNSETVFNSKIAVNLTVLLPSSIISGALFSFALKTNIIQTIFTILIPCVYSFFISVLGMFVNVKFPKYDWTSEYYAVKGGSASLMITFLIGMIMPMVFLALSIIFADYGLLIQLLGICLILLATWVIHNHMKQINLYA